MNFPRNLAVLLLAISAHIPTSATVDTERALLQNRGSDSMAIAVQALAEAYRKVEPNTGVALVGGGSRTGFAALIHGNADIANASRPITRKEFQYAHNRGKAPARHTVGHDAIAVYLHPDNPVDNLAFPQLAEIYGRGGKILRWSDLGVTVPGCENQEIIRVSRRNNSGTYALFRGIVLAGKRGYRLGILDMQSSKDVIALVENTPCAIGYSSLAYATPRVKTVCLSPKDGRACINPSIASILDKSYPLARPLYMYTDGEPSGEVKKYLDWILSDAGQCILLNKGYATVRPVDCDP